ncbi:periplasmic binding protein-like II, partial [Neocallimastix sp. 'constans']
MLEKLLKSKKRKYDMYFFEYIYNSRFGPYFINLQEYLPKEHIDIYSEGITPQLCVFNDKWVSLPIKISYDVLYCNMDLLEKYDKAIPETWDELIETSIYIMDREKDNDKDLISFNGLYDDTDTGTVSLFEYIYSFRDSVNSPFPSFVNETVINALEKLKYMKEKIASNEQFQQGTLYTLGKLNDGKALFIKYWNVIPNPVYKMSILPGIKKGISGSTIGGQSVGIGNDIGDKKINASVKILQYVTSREFRKNITLETLEYSTIPSLYDDDDICKVVDCKFMKSIQFVSRKFPPDYPYDDYSKEFRSFIYEYLYGDKPIIEALNEFDNLNKFYSISFSDSIGKAFGFILGIIAVILVVSLALPFIPNLRKYYKVLYLDFWIYSIFGTFLMFGLCFVGYGPVTVIKCHLRVFFFSFGLSFNLMPIICMFNKSIHKKDILWQAIKKQSYFVIMGVLLINNILYMFILREPFTIDKIFIKNGKNYNRCKSRSGLNRFCFYLLMILETLIIVIAQWLAFIKRNDMYLKKESRFLVISLYTVLLSLIMIFIVDTVNINDYNKQFILFEVFYILFSISNHFIFFIIRPLWLRYKKIDEELEYLKAFRSNTFSCINGSNNQKMNSKSPIYSKFSTNANSQNLLNHKPVAMSNSKVNSRVNSQ